MNVLKFGGTSVANAETWRKVVSIIKNQQPCAVVVSATAKTTNDLLSTAKLARQDSIESAREVAERIRQRHYDIIEELLPASLDQQVHTDAIAWVDKHLKLLDNFLLGIHTLGELTPRSLDMISSLGERISSYLIAQYARSEGVDMVHADARDIIKTNSEFGRAIPNMAKTREASTVLRHHLDQGKSVIMGGFFGTDANGEITTLGRGGSDYSAAILGMILNSDAIEIWTDVSGMYTSDPRFVKGTRPIEEITFDEAAELAYFGAKVLHPATIQPAIEQNIPVYIKNTFEADAPGTKIHSAAKLDGDVRAIAFKKDITIVTISSSRMLLAYGFLARVFGIFEEYEIAVDLVSTSEVSISMSVDKTVGLEPVLEKLGNIGDVSIRHGMSLVCVVGQQFLKSTGIASRIFQRINHIPIQLISQGSSDINLSFVVQNDHADEVVQELHDEFFD